MSTKFKENWGAKFDPSSCHVYMCTSKNQAHKIRSEMCNTLTRVHRVVCTAFQYTGSSQHYNRLSNSDWALFYTAIDQPIKMLQWKICTLWLVYPTSSCTTIEGYQKSCNAVRERRINFKGEVYAKHVQYSYRDEANSLQEGFWLKIIFSEEIKMFQERGTIQNSKTSIITIGTKVI